MFQECKQLEYLDLSNFDTSNINDMSYMFNKCHGLKQIKGINNFNSVKATTMNKMFGECNKLDLSKLSMSDFKDAKIIKQLKEDLSYSLLPKNDLNAEKKSKVTFKSTEKYINSILYFSELDMFSDLENELYLKYPELEDENISFVLNGKEIKKTSTIKESGIKDGDTILIKEIDSIFY